MRQVSVPFSSPMTRIASPSNRVIATFLFLFVLFAYLQFPIHESLGDMVWALPTAFSLVNEGNIDLTEYELLIKEFDSYWDYTLRYVDGKPYNLFAVGPSLIAAPFVAVFQQVSNKVLSVDLYALSQQQLLTGLNLFIASFVVAVAVACVYLIARFYLSNPFALFVSLIFAFATSALSTGSRGLWQHGPSMLACSVAFYCLLRAERSSAWLVPVGFVLAFGFINRPTNLVVLAVLTLYVVLRFRRQSLPFFLGAALMALPYIYLNLTVYGTLLPPYVTGIFWLVPNVGVLIEAALGLLISPNRGLFIFSPILLLSIWGVGVKLRARSLTGLDYSLLAIVLLHWFQMSLFGHWYGGHCFGPRYMSDILPFIVFFMIPFFSVLPTLPKNVKVFAIGFVTLATLVSVAIHMRGAIAIETRWWNVDPDVHFNQGRVWDWNDLQFLRGLGATASIEAPEPMSNYHLEFDIETAPFAGDGWGDPELSSDGTTFQWTVANEASLNLWLVADGDLEVEIGILHAITPEILETFQFDVNGFPVELRVNGQVYSGVIPVGALNADGGPNALRFTVTDPVSPRSLDQGADARTLGLKLNYLEIRPLGDSSE